MPGSRSRCTWRMPQQAALPRRNRSPRSVYTATRHSATRRSSEARRRHASGRRLDAGGIRGHREAACATAAGSTRSRSASATARLRWTRSRSCCSSTSGPASVRHRRTAQPRCAAFRNRLMFFPILRLRRRLRLDVWRARPASSTLLGQGDAAVGPAVVGRHPAGRGGGRPNVQVRTVQPCVGRPTASASGENPHYEIDDRRTGIAGRVERRLFGVADASAPTLDTPTSAFVPANDGILDVRRRCHARTHAATRRFRRDAVLLPAPAGIRLRQSGRRRRLSIGCYRLDGRGYKTNLIGQAVLGARARVQ